MLLDLLFAVSLASGWESHGPELPYVASVVVAAGESRRLYAIGGGGSNLSSIFRSTDGGESWEALAEAPPAEFFTNLQGDPRDPDRLFAVTVHVGFPTVTTHLYRSVDGGATLTQLQSLYQAASGSVALDPNRPGALYAAYGASYGGQPHFFRSEDGGDSFVERPAPFDGAALQVGPDGALRAVSAGGVYASRDEGESWELAIAPPASCSSIAALAIDPTDANRMFLGTGIPSAPCGEVLRSDDGGATWSATADVEGPVTDVKIDPSRPSFVYVATAPIEPSTVVARVLVSGDEGRAWRDLRLPVSIGANEIAPSPDGRRLYAATSAGVYALGLRRTSVIAPRGRSLERRRLDARAAPVSSRRWSRGRGEAVQRSITGWSVGGIRKNPRAPAASECTSRRSRSESTSRGTRDRRGAGAAARKPTRFKRHRDVRRWRCQTKASRIRTAAA